MQEVKRLPENARSFQANGKTYIIHELLTLDAYRKLEELRIEIQAGTGPAGVLSLANRAYTALNASKFADASVILYNLINAAEPVAEGRPPLFMLALTLFARPEGSDVTQWNQAEAEEWLKDWNAEGYSASDFFALASSRIIGYTEFFAVSIRDISETANEPSGSAG